MTDEVAPIARIADDLTDVIQPAANFDAQEGSR